MFVYAYRTMFLPSDTRIVLFKGYINSVLLITKASLAEYKLILVGTALSLLAIL